jgi:formylmethanofuran dehydrogenase subunit E
MAATFVDLTADRAVRIAARESSKEAARKLYPEIESKNQAQMLAYRELSSEALFTEQWVQVEIEAREFPGYKGDRVACAVCGEGINYDRYVMQAGQTLCRGCAAPDERYYRALKE